MKSWVANTFSILGKFSCNKISSCCMWGGDAGNIFKFSALQKRCRCTCSLAQTCRSANSSVLGAHIQLCAVLHQPHDGSFQPPRLLLAAVRALSWLDFLMINGATAVRMSAHNMAWF